VTPHCVYHLQRRYPETENIIYDIDNYGGHLQSIYTFYPKVKKMLDAEK
jgi:hypothetical protein